MLVRKTVVTIIGTTLGSLASGAWAQQAASVQDGVALEEIIVTAEKRSTDLQKTPISVTALSGTDLQAQAKNTVEDVFATVPEVRLQNNPIGGTQLFLRGVGPALSTDPAVSMFVDGVYQSSNNGGTPTSGTIYDIARVEVLRGPQGTLYGRNAAGGAANIITNDPTDEFGASASVQYGNYNAMRTELMLNAPLTQSVDARIAVLTQSHDGYFSSRYGDEDTKAARLKLLIKPIDNLSILLTGSYVRQGGYGPGVTYPPVIGQPGLLSDPWTTAADDQLGRQDVKKSDVYANIEWDFGWGTLTYLPAWYNWKSHVSTDPLGKLSNFSNTQTSTYQNTHELRLASSADSSITWVGGLYYLHTTQSAVQCPMQLAAGVSGTCTPPYPLLFTQDPVTDSAAAFGQLTVPITASLRVTGGARYTKDKKETTAVAYDVVGVTAVQNTSVTPLTQKGEWSKSTWLARVEYDLAPQSLLYASVSTGYKSGGLNGASFNGPRTVILPGSTYEPEELTDYEIGIKNRLFDNRLQLNASAFYYDYKNIQEFIISPGSNSGPPTASIVNATKATLYGAELSTLWSITRNDQLSASVNYLHTEFGTFRYQSLFYGTPPDFVVDSSGERLASAPEWGGSLSYEHIFDFGDAGTLTFGGTFRAYSDYTASAEPAFNAYQPDYHQSDARLTYGAASGKWNVSGFVNNIENEAPILFVQNIPPLGLYRNSIGAPRTYGVYFSIRY